MATPFTPRTPRGPRRRRIRRGPVLGSLFLTLVSACGASTEQQLAAVDAQRSGATIDEVASTDAGRSVGSPDSVNPPGAATTPEVSSAARRAPAPSTPATPATRPTTTTRPPATSQAAPTTAAPTTAAPAAPSVFDATSEVVVSFSYAASGGRMKNPFVAVWIEDAAGNPVRTLDVSYEQGKGVRWLPDLKRWYRSYGNTDAGYSVSSATRLPGDYSFVWDGRDDTGALVPTGSYYVNVESAREHGPYQLVRAGIALDGSPFDQLLGSDGELSNVTATLRA